MNRAIPLLLLVAGACTGPRPIATPPPSTGPAAATSPGLRMRTSLEMEVGPSEYVGSFRASGTLNDQSGRPVVGADIRVALTPLEGPGTLESYTLTGTVPAQATQGSVGLRVNTECQCKGAADLALYDVAYAADGRSANLVPNGDFATGLRGWTFSGSSRIRLRRSDLGGGSMLRVLASSRQSLVANSAGFPVTAGDRFTVTFDSRVAPGSVGSGYFLVLFRGSPGEVGREQIPFAPASFALGTRTTDEKGFFRATFHPPGVELPLGRVRVEAWFDGDQRFLPAYARGTILLH